MLRVDLHLHSHFSHDGKSSLQQLIDRAHECKLDRIALTDHNTVEGALTFVRIAPALAIAGEEVKTLEGEVIGLFYFFQLAQVFVEIFFFIKFDDARMHVIFFTNRPGIA